MIRLINRVAHWYLSLDFQQLRAVCIVNFEAM